MEVASINLIPGTGMVITQDIWATIDREMHAHSPELGVALRDMVVALTPVLTGALVLDMEYEAYPSPGGYGMGPSDIVWVYAADLAQQAFWNRVYVLYQEGGLLGLSTWTNDPHEMFYKTALGDGLDATEAWALYWAEHALALSAIGMGVHLP